MALQRQAALGALWGTVERVVTQGISFIVVLILARILGPDTYGMVTLAATCALLGQTLLGTTFSTALIQAKSIEPEHTASVFWMLLAGGVATTVGLLLSADSLAGLFDEAALAPIFRALSPLMLCSALQAVPMALFMRALDFRAIATATTGGTLLGGIVGVGLALGGFGVGSLIANLLVQNTVVTAVIWRRSTFRPRLAYSPRHLRELWSYGQYTFLGRITGFVTLQGPRLLIGYLFGPGALGEFSLGLRVVEIMNELLTLPAANVVVPVVAKLRHDPVRLESAVLRATQLAAMIAVPAFLGLALVAPVAVPLMFGSRWAGSVTIVQILAFYGILNSAGFIGASIISGLGRQDINLGVGLALTVVLVGALLLLTAFWGFEAAAVAMIIRGAATLAIQPILTRRLTGIRVMAQWRAFGPIIPAAAIMALVVTGLLSVLQQALHQLALTVTVVVLGAVTYALALYLFARPAWQLGISVLRHIRQGRASAEPSDSSG